MKKNISHISLLALSLWVFGVFGVPHSSAATAANSCVIASGPIQELGDYRARIDNELSEMIRATGNNSCRPGIRERADIIFEAAYSDLSALQGVVTDFAYNTKVSFKSDTYSGVRRDEKYFDQIEKRIGQAAESLAARCWLTDENTEKLRRMIQEVQLLKRVYQNTAIGSPDNALKSFAGIREENKGVADAITQAYSPEQTVSCVDNSATQQSFTETIKNITNLGAKKEDALSTWRKAIALIQGGGDGLSPTEYTSRQRQLLSAELSRQGLSSNAQKVILQNFDCYKSKTLFSNDPMDFASARGACLSAPIAGTDKLFSGWQRYVNSARTTDDRATREREKNARQTRTIHIVEMYNTLNAMTSAEQDINTSINKNLVDWHLSLQLTNELLEARTQPMQRNCMKWQPDIVGGCQ